MARSGGPVAIILGTRPEIIKMSPVIRLFKKKGRPFTLIHTGQHYSFDMDQQFFMDLELPAADLKFSRPPSMGANRHQELVKWMSDSLYRELERLRPSAVLVQGDTDTVLAGARAASQVGGITIGHVEAGLRSFDESMPEERNRVEADKLSHLLFAPTESAKKNLVKEKITGRIEITGNTIVDALRENLEIAEKKAPNGREGYALVTLHRPETVDDKERLTSVFRALDEIAEKTGLTMLFPVHPRTRARLHEHGIRVSELPAKRFELIEPIGFLDFIRYEKNAKLVLTDSGGVQEESCVLGVPCVTIRTTTERPETVEVGANVVTGYDPGRIVSRALEMLARPNDWKNPFGDGKAAERILEAI